MINFLRDYRKQMADQKLDSLLRTIFKKKTCRYAFLFPMLGLMVTLTFAEEKMPTQTEPLSTMQTQLSPMMHVQGQPTQAEAPQGFAQPVEMPTQPKSNNVPSNDELIEWLRSQSAQQETPKSNPAPPAANAMATTSGPTIVPESVQGLSSQNPGTMPPRQARRQRVRFSHPLTYEESLKVMQQSLPPSQVQPSEDADIAFNQLLQQNMPLSPQQVLELHQQIDVSQRAAATPPVVPPKPVSSTLMINLAPGTTPPAVRLAQGYVSSLVFVDSTGAPWPIAAFDIGNPKAVNIQWDGKSNILILQAVNPYSNGDIVVQLVGLPTPITLELVAGQRVVDYRVDIHVAGIGPNTKELPIGTALPNSANQLLLGVLDGVAPAGSKPLSVKGIDALAWLLGERIYLRTRFTVLSPGWIGTMVSSDGMHAYEIPRTSSVLISRYGEPVEIRIEGF